MTRGDFSLEREPAPCPSCGRPGGTLVRIAGSAIPVPCDACSDAAAEALAEQQRARRVDDLLRRAGGSPRMSGWSLDTYPADAARRAALEAGRAWLGGYLEGQRANLLLYGSVGSGKSGLAWGLVRRLCELEHEALFLNFRALLADLRQSFGDRRAGLPTDYVRADRVPVLALDDVGSERPTDFAREELANLVEERYGRARATIMTSNYEPGELAARLGHDDPAVGQRIVSRLADGAIQYRIRGGDLRLR